MEFSEVRTALYHKLDNAWKDFKNRVTGYSPGLIFELAEEIAAAKLVCTELYTGNYPQDQLEYLLRFEDPLEVVREQWLKESKTALGKEMSHVVWNIWDKKDAERLYILDPKYEEMNQQSNPAPAIEQQME